MDNKRFQELDKEIAVLDNMIPDAMTMTRYEFACLSGVLFKFNPSHVRNTFPVLYDQWSRFQRPMVPNAR